MHDLLAVIHEPADDERVLGEIERRHPRRVTLLLETAAPDSNRLAWLGAEVVRRTGAVIVGSAANRAQLEGWRFDDVAA